TLRHPGNAFGGAAVELPDWKAVAFHMPHHARLDQLSGRIHHAADDPLGRDPATDETARVHAAHNAAGQLPTVAVEVPVRDAVLHGHPGGVGPEELRHLFGDGLELVGLHGENHQVLRAGSRVITGHGDVADDVLAAVGHDELQAARAYGVDVGAAHAERYLLA